jgi:putative transcriptional regulator
LDYNSLCVADRRRVARILRAAGNERANLSKAERNQLAGLVDMLVQIWSRGDVMGKAFDSIRRGLVEATEHAKGRQAGVKVYQPAKVDVAAVRARLGFTQAQFASRFGVSVATLRHWERGDRSPQGPALVLLNLIDRDPKGVLRALS